MKKRNLISIFSFLFFLLAFQMGYGQEKDIETAIRAGFLTGELSGDLDDNFQKNKKNFYVGLMHERKIAASLKFSSSLEYLQTGAEEDENNKISISYLSLPVGLKLSIANFYGRAGVAGMLRIGQSEIVGGEENDPVVLDYKRLGLNAYGALGIRFAMLEFEVRYNRGITDAVEELSNEYWQLGINFFIK